MARVRPRGRPSDPFRVLFYKGAVPVWGPKNKGPNLENYPTDQSVRARPDNFSDVSVGRGDLPLMSDPRIVSLNPRP